MRRAISMACVSTILSITAPAVIKAESEMPISSVDQITVYATRSPRSTFDVPAMVTIIDADAAGNALSGDVGDLLEFTPGVEVDNGARRNGQTLSIRGFDNESIITLIDGRRQNFESAHDGRFFIDPSLIKTIEVVRGASSAIYGGGGVGGVVAFETKDAVDLLAPGETSGVLAALGARSANSEISSTLSGYTITSGWDILGNITYRDSGDIETGDGNELDTDDRILSGLFKASNTFNDFHTLKFQAQILNNDGQEPNNGSGAITPANPLVNKEVKDNQFSIKYEYENPDNAWLSPNLHLYYNDTEVEEEDISGSNNAGRIQAREIETLGFTLDNQTIIDSNQNTTHTISYGLEIYNDRQVGTNTFTAGAIRGGVPNAEATNYGIYIQDEIKLDTASGEFLIIPAARFDNYDSEDDIGNSQDENEISPKLSLSYKPNNGVVLFGSWARAFRAPNLTELYPIGQHFPGVSFCPAPMPGCPPVPLVVVFPDNIFVPNPNLEPETVTTIELGFGLDLKRIFSSDDRLTFKAVYFDSDGDNFISQIVDTGGGTTMSVNIDNASIEGFELESQYQLNPVTAKISLSFTEAKNDATGEFLTLNNVPLTLLTDFNSRVNANSILGWRSRYARANDNVAEGDLETAGYGVHDLYYRWSPKQRKKLVIDLGVENIFDKPYQKRTIPLLEEGRSFVARLQYQW